MNKKNMTNLTPTEQAYQKIKNAQSFILGVCAFTLVNLILYFTGSDNVYLFSIFFPIVAAFNSGWGFMGLYGTACIAVYAVLPLVIFAGLGFAAKKKPSIITALTVLYGIDTLYLLYFSFAGGFDSYFIMFILFHAYIIFVLITGMKGAKDLKSLNDGENLTMEELETKVNETQAQKINELRRNNIVLTYDAEYARMNGAHKTGATLMALGYIAALMISILGSMFLSISIDVGGGAMAILIIGLIIAETVVFFMLLNKRLLMNNQKVVMYVIDANRVVNVVSKNPALQNMQLYNLHITEDYGNYYGALYTDKKGKEKKIYIPKAYPGLDEAFRKIGALY